MRAADPTSVALLSSPMGPTATSTALGLILLLLLSVFLGGQALSFSLDQGADGFRCQDNVLCLGNATTDGQSGQLSLISGPRETLFWTSGVAMYSTPVGMTDHRVSAVASFNTSFTFETKAEGKQGPKGLAHQEPGDGLTFFITDNTVVSGAYGANFGVFYPEGHRDPNTTVVAVEFDTYLNWEYDYTPTPHVGLDIGSIKSKVSAPLFNTCRFENGLCSVWIDYDGASGKLVVCADSLPAKPKKALLNTVVNLTSVFVSAESFWVGLSAGTGSRASSYVVKSWNFSSFWPAGPARRARGPEPYRSVFRTVVIVASVCASILVVSVLVMTVALRRRRVMSATTLAQQELNSHIPTTYSFQELEDATGGFSEEFRLGEGGFGEVYRGVMPRTQALVAIKRLKEQSPQGEKEFLSEVAAITQIRHRHVVQLLGWCDHRGAYMLVYEYMPNGSLDKVLFGPRRDVLLWPRRKRIVAGVAAALHYLHEGWSKQVLHRDIKSSNILLDSLFEAKLGDFGLAVTGEHQKLLSSTKVVGTEGYLAPEAAILGKYTAKSDVYAFGIVLLETATGRRAIDTRFPENEMILVKWVWRCFREGDLLRAADPLLAGKFRVSEMRQMLLLGLLCANPDSNARPSSRQIIQRLFGEAPILPSADPESCLRNCRGHFEEYSTELLYRHY